MRNTMFAACLCATAVSPAVAAANDDEACKTVRFSDLGWTDIALTNTTATTILEALGYEAKQSLLGLNVTYESMKNGGIDAFLGNWRPVQDENFKSYFDDGSVVPLVTNLSGAKYTLVVPKYVADEGVTSFNDLAAHADKFDSKIYGIEPGSNSPLLDMVAAKRHDLGDWQIVESSEAAMLSQAERAIKDKDWVVFLGWQPHPMNTTLDLVYLADGDEEFGPDFGGATVRTLVRGGYPELCPNVTKLLTNLVFDIDYENAGMNLIMNEGEDVPDAAKAMMKEHPEKLDEWLDGVTTFDGKPGLEAVKAELGIAE